MKKTKKGKKRIEGVITLTDKQYEQLCRKNKVIKRHKGRFWEITCDKGVKS